MVFSTPVVAKETQGEVAVATQVNKESSFKVSNGEIIQYTGRETDVVIPDTIDGEIIKAIGDKVFFNKKLTSIKIPNTVDSIGKQSFANNKLTDIGLPQSLISMGIGAFSMNELTSVTIPEGLKKIPDMAFSKNKLTSVIISEGVTSIGMGSFTINELESLVIPDSVIFIDKIAFKQNRLKSVKISKNIETIGISVFDTNQLQAITIPEAVKKIDDAAFRKNQLQFVTIPVNVATIGKSVFDESVGLTYSKLVEAIKNAENIKTNGKSEEKIQALKETIEGAKQLNSKSKATLAEVNEAVEKINKAIKALEEEISVKNSIKEIKPLENIEVELGLSEADAKKRLPEKVVIVDSLDKEYNIKIAWSILEYHGNIVGEYTGIGTFELPEGVVQSDPPMDLKITVKIIVDSKEAEDKRWNIKDFTYTGTAIIGFSESGKEKFEINKDLILPKLNKVGQAITEIGDKAFVGDYTTKQNPNKGINSVRIPDTVITIGAEAFRYNCLTSIDIPSSVSTIKMSAFNGNKLKTLVIPDTVTKLEGGAFTLNEIESLTLPNSWTTIPQAFAFNNLTSVTIPEGVTRIEDLAFSDNRLSEVKLPSTLKYLSGLNNNEFRSITIPKNVNELGKKALASNWMTSVTIPGNVKIIGERAFWNTWHDQFLSSVVIEEGVEKINAFAFCNNHLKDVELPSSVKQLHKDTFSTNLGYDGVVHVYTPNYQNPNNFEENKYQIINPGKIIIKYIFEDKVLKEKETWKNPKTGEYLHVGDKDIEVAPEYSNNEYELKDTNIIKVDLNDKEEVVSIQCNKKQVSENMTIKSIGNIAPVVVDFGTNKAVVMDKLAKKTFIVDSNDQKQEVQLNWIVEAYDGDKSGEYTAIGTFKLPEGVVQSEPETKLEVVVRIIVKENFENLVDTIWKVEDFTYKGTRVTGFSEVGKEKLKTNKDLVLPKVNEEGQSITDIGENAFAKMGLISLIIPEGLNGLVIEAGAFQENELKRVFIPEGVSEILTFSFYKNDLIYVDFPGTVKKIGNQAFADNKLVSVTISKGQDTICLDRFSFYNNELTSVTILKDIKKIHGEAFKDNKGYENDNSRVHIFIAKLDPENNGLFEFSDYHRVNLLAIESVEEVKLIETALGTEKSNRGLPEKIKLKLNNGDIKEVQVTWLNEQYNVNKAGEYTFTGFYDLPEGMTGEKKDISAKIIVVHGKTQVDEEPNGELIEDTGKGSDVVISDTIAGEIVETIENKVFSNKNLTSVKIPNTVETIGKESFAKNKLASVEYPKELINTESTSLTIPEDITTIARSETKVATGEADAKTDEDFIDKNSNDSKSKSSAVIWIGLILISILVLVKIRHKLFKKIQ
nr:leucine-rich repeat protein [Clostridium algidicarnis]